MTEPVFVVDPAAPRRFRYAALLTAAETVLPSCPDLVSAMAHAVSLAERFLPELLWIGFYRTIAPGVLAIGPYRGALGCSVISFDRGVCGTAATTKETLIVPDVSRFPGHIACDAAAASEIAVPLMDAHGEVIGVLDADSERLGDFGEDDRSGLEALARIVADRHSAAM